MVDDPHTTAPHIKVLSDGLPWLQSIAEALSEADAFGEAVICNGLMLLVRSIVETETVLLDPEADVHISPDGTRYLLPGDGA
jgi:hypothetical protein